MLSRTTCVSWLIVLSRSLQACGAVIVADSGNISEIAPPPSVEYHVLESNDLVFVFAEQSSTTLTSDIVVDITSPGTVASLGDLTTGLIGTGSTVQSFFVHYDPVNFNDIDASITFDMDILALIVLDDTLDITDSELGNPGTTYPNDSVFRGLDLVGGAVDVVTLSNDRRTVTLDMRTEAAVDSLRVLFDIQQAATIPEPASLIVWLLITAVYITARLRRSENTEARR